MSKKIVLASNNRNKIKEFQEILNSKDIELISQSTLNIPEAEETGLTFVENALIKARNASYLSKLPAIADDSGIEVDALSGRPGIYSARYAGTNCDDQKNNQLLLEELSGIPLEQRTARYHCTIVYLQNYDHPVPRIYNSSWEGLIGLKEEGKNGFGYDPLFYLPELKCTSAELSEAEKNSISHRGKALKLFKDDFS
jgi:XTP/dITP diphosphohydrolase